MPALCEGETTGVEGGGRQNIVKGGCKGSPMPCRARVPLVEKREKKVSWKVCRSTRGGTWRGEKIVLL